MRNLLIVMVLLKSLFAVADQHEHREHAAHVHGSATLAIAFDGMSGTLEFKAPSESIYGFEHEAKSDADKKIMNEALDKIEMKISQMVVFHSSVKCVLTKNKIEVLAETEKPSGKKKTHALAEHSSISASFSAVCEKSPVGSSITFNIQKFFPKLKDVDVTILADKVQANGEAQKNATVIEVR